MSRTSRVLAGLAGFAVAFVFVMLVSALSPAGQPESGEVELRYEAFGFVRGGIETTEGSTLVMVNGGAVPVVFNVTAPGGDNVTVRLAPESERGMVLAQEGTYTVQVTTYDWSEAEVVVRTANPFLRFFEDLF